MDFIYEIAGVQRPNETAERFHNEAGDIEFTPSAITVTGKPGWTTTIFGSAFGSPCDTAAALARRRRRSDPIHGPNMVHYPRRAPAA